MACVLAGLALLLVAAYVVMPLGYLAIPDAWRSDRCCCCWSTCLPALAYL